MKSIIILCLSVLLVLGCEAQNFRLNSSPAPFNGVGLAKGMLVASSPSYSSVLIIATKSGANILTIMFRGTRKINISTYASGDYYAIMLHERPVYKIIQVMSFNIP